MPDSTQMQRNADDGLKSASILRILLPFPLHSVLPAVVIAYVTFAIVYPFFPVAAWLFPGSTFGLLLLGALVDCGSLREVPVLFVRMLVLAALLLPIGCCAYLIRPI